MRFSTVAAAVLAAAPAMVSADTKKGTMGFALGTKQPDGTCKSQSDYESDFDAIKQASGATIVRGYAAADCNMTKAIMPAAKKKGIQVVLGIWPDVEDSFNNDLSAIEGVAEEYKDNIYAVTVGSETLYRGNFTGEELKDKIETVKGKLDGIKVGTADSWNKFADGTADALLGSVDILMINAFAFWQGAGNDNDGNNATKVYLKDMFEAISHVEKKLGGHDKVEIWNGETGWPTGDKIDYANAHGGLKNAENFWKHGYCALLNWGFNAFYFEAFDETWKPKTKGDNGEMKDETKWGAMNDDRSSKFALKC